MLEDDFIPCPRCGWPVDDTNGIEVTATDGVAALMHPLCAPRSIAHKDRLVTEDEHTATRPG